MTAAAAKLEDPHGLSVPLRVGFATGTVVAGVVGSRRFFYDVWGDAVNVAARMESTDSVGQIQVPEDVYERLKDEFVLQERGRIEVKGKGVMRTWYLIGRKPVADESGDLRCRGIPHGPRRHGLKTLCGCRRLCHTAAMQPPLTLLFRACCRICGNPR